MQQVSTATLNVEWQDTNLEGIKVVPAGVAEVGEELPATDVGEEEVEEGGVLPALSQGDQEGVGDCLNTGRNIRENQQTSMMIQTGLLSNTLFS